MDEEMQPGLEPGTRVKAAGKLGYGRFVARATELTKPGVQEQPFYGVVVKLDNGDTMTLHPSMVEPMADDVEHVFLIAVTEFGALRLDAQASLYRTLTEAFERDDLMAEWWEADDDRNEGSDNDSAVFVHKGRQREALALLHDKGLTADWNRPDEESRVQEGRSRADAHSPASPGITDVKNHQLQRNQDSQLSQERDSAAAMLHDAAVAERERINGPQESSPSAFVRISWPANKGVDVTFAPAYGPGVDASHSLKVLHAHDLAVDVVHRLMVASEVIAPDLAVLLALLSGVEQAHPHLVNEARIRVAEALEGYISQDQG